MKVSVVKADNYNIEIVDKAVNDAVNLIGGWQNFIKKGDKVLIKPNMLTNVTPEKAVTTHPEVVRAVIKAVKNMGALPAVGDSPGISNLKSTAKRTGILTICEEENVPFVYFKQSKAYNYMEGRFIKQFELVDCLSDFDKIISVAKMKTHVFMGVTGAVKNQGVYGLQEGSRIADAIEKAGGTTEEADIEKINLAYLLEDGMKIKIPTKNSNETNEEITKESGLEEENKTAGGIIIPDNAKEKPSRGRVIAVGEGAFDGDDRIPMTVKANDVVLFAKWASSVNEVKINGKDYILIKETDILGILE